MVAISSPKEVDLEVYRGDTGRFRINVIDDYGQAVDVSLAEWAAEIRSAANSPTKLAEFTVEVVNGEMSKVDVILDATNSGLLTAGTLAYDVQMTLDGEVTTLVRGALEVTQDVSRPVSP